MTTVEGKPAAASALTRPRVYPLKIRVIPHLHEQITLLGESLAAGNVGLHQLPDCLLEFHTFAWYEGFNARNREVAALIYKADRYYYEFCRRKGQPFIDPNTPSYAELERIRGNTANAARIETANAERFSDAP